MPKTVSKSHPPRRPSGFFSGCCMIWKHCCCTYGFYPLIVAPIITAAFFISIYSSSDCHFIEVDVGFLPTNRAWNESELLDLGLFFQYRPDLPDHPNDYRRDLHESCHSYSSAFEEEFTNVDRTWKVARIMSYIAAGGGLVASIVAWAIVVLPLPSDCLWPSFLLPCAILGFIGEGSKFLFLDIAICRAPIWFPDTVDLLPTAVESCFLGRSAYACIIAGVLYGIGLLLICLNTPEKRHLDADFNQNYPLSDQSDVEGHKPTRVSFHEPVLSDITHASHKKRQQRRILDQEMENDNRSCEEISVNSPLNLATTTTSTMQKSSTTTSQMQFQEDPKTRQIDLYDVPSVSSMGSVSESRLSALTKMERCTSVSSSGDDELVTQLLSDLDASFRDCKH